jgi:hypothetical protein
MVNVDIENIIASALIAQALDLPKIAESIEGAEYNPDRFPGVVLRFESPRIVVLIFEKGRLMCTGGRSVEDVQTVMDNVHSTLKELDLLGPPPEAKPEKPEGEAGPTKPEGEGPTESVTELPPEVEAEIIARGEGPEGEEPPSKEPKTDEPKADEPEAEKPPADEPTAEDPPGE